MMGLTQKQKDQITKFEFNNITENNGKIITASLFKYDWNEVSCKYRVEFPAIGGYIVSEIAVNVDKNGTLSQKTITNTLFNRTPKASCENNAQTFSPELTGDQ